MSSHGLQAATAFGVGMPDDAVQLSLYVFGIHAYPQTLTLAAGAGSRQLKLDINGLEGLVDLAPAAAGTGYVVSDSAVISVTQDGLVSGLSPGDAQLTVLNGPAELVIPVHIE